MLLIACDNQVNEENENMVNNVTDVSNTESETINEVNEETEPVEEDTTELEAELAIGKQVPNYMFERLDGTSVQLEEHFGKIIVLNFWATWCPYCIEEMPDLDELNAEDDVVVLAVNVQEKKSVVEAYLDEHPYEFDVFIDEVGYFSNKFYISSLPTTFFINEDGELLGSMPGMMTRDQMFQIIEDIRNGEL
jgi:thiol-disulfide isomerase/thioredoxin